MKRNQKIAAVKFASGESEETLKIFRRKPIIVDVRREQCASQKLLTVCQQKPYGKSLLNAELIIAAREELAP